MTKRIKPIKVCSVCGKLIRSYNKSGLCTKHYQIRQREIKKEQKRLTPKK